jgi:thioesterase domain-containing protein
MECDRRAAERHYIAATAPDAVTKAELIEIERRWRDMARVTIRPLRSGSSQKVLYFIQKPDEYAALSGALTSELSIATVAPKDTSALRELIADRDISSAIKRIAEVYAQAIIDTGRDSKRIYLAGYSFGGILAIETACELEERGFKPDMVFLFDTFLRPAAHRIFYDVWHNKWLARKVKEVTRGDRREFARRIRSLSRRLFYQSKGYHIFKETSTIGGYELQTILRESGGQTYRGPNRTLTSDVVLFRSSWLFGVEAHRQQDPNLGWANNLRGTLTLIPIHCDHSNILKDDNLNSVAAQMNRRIAW